MSEPVFVLRGLPPIAEMPAGYRYALEGELAHYGNAEVLEFSGREWVVVGVTYDGATIEETDDDDA